VQSMSSRTQYNGRILVLCCTLVVSSASSRTNFLGYYASPQHRVDRRIQASLNVVLDKTNQQAARQLKKIEAAMWPTFQAAPTNSKGRLDPRVVRHMIKNYFVATHGWIINGLDPHGTQSNRTDAHHATVLRKKVPALAEALLEAQRAGLGLVFDDVVALAAALERLIFDESLEILEAAFLFNGHASSELVSQDELNDILTSYLSLFEMGKQRNLTDVDKHRKLKSRWQSSSTWASIVELAEDTLRNEDYISKDRVNPFSPRKYSFQEAWHVVEHLVEGYGQWQNVECHKMMEALVQLDRVGTGRVFLHDFYSQPKTAVYQFAESTDYLLQIGAINMATGTPQVRISNYMEGPSNCIVDDDYYSICCLSACESIMGEVERQVRSPVALSQQLLHIVGNISSAYVDAPRELPHDLRQKLWTIADRHRGMVPLHSRLFAQWLHFAFPAECPFPHIPEDSAVFKPGNWMNVNRKKYIASEEDKERLIREGAEMAQEVDVLAVEWSDNQVLLFEDQQSAFRSTVWFAARLIGQLALALVLIRTLWIGMCSAMQASSTEELSGKKDISFAI